MARKGQGSQGLPCRSLPYVSRSVPGGAGPIGRAGSRELGSRRESLKNIEKEDRLQRLGQPSPQDVLVFGSGGSARAVCTMCRHVLRTACSSTAASRCDRTILPLPCHP